MSRVVEQYKRACNSLAGGVSSSTRVNQAVGHAMLFDRAEGCRVWDLDGREYIDLCCSHGATLLGHGDPRITEAVERTLARGAACSYENELHTELAELLCDTVPCLERVRFTGSGTETTMHCIRLARAVTGRTKLVRFEGNFHGYHDQVMWGAAGEVGQTNPPLAPQSTGITPGVDQHLIQIPYNRPDLLEEVFAAHAAEIAAVICEPVWYNAGCVLPTAEFVNTMRRLTSEHDSVLIFDEVLSGFRMCAGGAQEYLGVTPDLCTLGKAVGGTYPLSVFGGRGDLMERLMPQGDCQHSGTYNGHCVLVAAAGAAVRAYREPSFYPHIHAIAERLCSGLAQLFNKHGVPGRVQWLGARFGIYFGVGGEVRDYADAQKHDREMMLKFIAAAIENGVYFHDYGGAAVHHGFCAAMKEDDVDEALQRLDCAIADLIPE
jgi:glutamate-1-semialdehyde 2,1-aminomutase